MITYDYGTRRLNGLESQAVRQAIAPPSLGNHNIQIGLHSDGQGNAYVVLSADQEGGYATGAVKIDIPGAQIKPRKETSTPTRAPKPKPEPKKYSKVRKGK